MAHSIHHYKEISTNFMILISICVRTNQKAGVTVVKEQKNTLKNSDVNDTDHTHLETSELQTISFVYESTPINSRKIVIKAICTLVAVLFVFALIRLTFIDIIAICSRSIITIFTSTSECWTLIYTS